MSSAQVSAWLEQAFYDARSSLVLLQAGQWSASCLASQQCCEKIIKALTLYMGVPIEFSHSLKKLQDHIQQAVQNTLPEAAPLFPAHFGRAAQVMTKTFQTSRYPGMDVDEPPYALFSDEDAREHLRWASDYVVFAAEQMPMEESLLKKASALQADIASLSG